MKIIRISILCLVCAVAWAQRDSDELQQIDPTTGKAAAVQPAAQAPQTAPTPIPQPTAPATPEPQDLAPAAPTGPQISAAPELPKYPDVRMPGESGWSFGAFVWAPKEHPIFNRGRAAFFPQSSLLTMQGTPKFADGAEVGIALGLHNQLRLSWFTARAAGDFTAPNDMTMWNQTYLAGTLVSTNYTVQDFKLSFDYLSWPYPVESRRFRLLSEWQLQYVSVRSVFDAPQLPLVDSSGNPLLDAGGNPISYAGQGTRWFLTPAFGLGAREYFTKDLRLEINASGFSVPRHWTLWDTDAKLSYRVGHVEVLAGIKAFHYKTSTQAEFFLKNTMISPVVSLRWYSD